MAAIQRLFGSERCEKNPFGHRNVGLRGQQGGAAVSSYPASHVGNPFEKLRDASRQRLSWSVAVPPGKSDCIAISIGRLPLNTVRHAVSPARR